MTRHSITTTAAIFAAVGITALTACDNDTPKTTESALEVADIKGIRFDEPAPAQAEAQTMQGEVSQVAAAPTASVTPQAATGAPIPTAEDVPDNIALIPSATPVAVAAVPASTPEPEVAAPAAAAPVAAGDYQEVTFKVLAGFKYVEPVPNEGEKPEDVEKRRQSDQIPAEVKALNGTKAVVQGWMVPMEISEDGSVKSFVLVNTQPECCFGDMQAMNEWIDVVMQPGTNAEFNVDRPVKVYGDLEVGEKTEDGFVLSVYRMKANRVEL